MLTTDSCLALADFSIFISEPNEFKLRQDTDLAKWKLPHINLEFDHARSFDILSMDEIVYFRCDKTKGTYSGIPDSFSDKSGQCDHQRCSRPIRETILSD
jgi:hypothetical protein